MRDRFMARAIELSISNVRAGTGGPFAAVIVKAGRIVAEGANLVTSTRDPTAHAEIVAIRTACRELKNFYLTGCILYTTCEPCPMCLGAVYWAHLKQVYFANTRDDAALIGFDDSLIYRELVLPPRSRKIEMTQLMRSQALVAFREWHANPDKLLY